MLGVPDPRVVRATAERMGIVHHPPNEDTTSLARDWLKWAERIFFLGFSYHELNLKKLGIPESVRGKHIRGTRCGMGLGPLSRVKRLTDGVIGFEDEGVDIMNVIDRYAWFYE